MCMAEVCAMSRIITVLGWLKEHWGDMSQLILGFIAIMLAVRPQAVLDLEKKSPLWKLGAPIVFGIIAISGFVASQGGTAELKRQIGTLYIQTTSIASKDDVANLTTHIDDGFE